MDKSSEKYVCENCDYYTSRKSQYNRHLLTDKHKNLQNPTYKKFYTEKKFICNCGKSYKHSSTLYAHKKTCDIKNITNNINDTIIENNMNDKEIIMMLIKDNNDIKNILFEQQNMMIKMIENGSNITNHNNNINSHNKTFNLQVFLNETCKDAMNINDFVDSIKLQLSDFERMGEVGYAQGISDIITSKLQALDITQRPVHCTDKKRETMYVKDQDQWTKEDENKTKIKKMIKRIENKNIQIIPQFQKKYPNYANPKSHESDKYHKTIIEVMGGAGGSEGKEGKIIRNISKVTTIREKE
jgi:hypothetical protein